ncbi:DUF3291 domain-containing protein [Streptomyces sp. NPDC054784]
MPHLALYTFGILNSPLAVATPLMGAFYDAGEAVHREIARRPGHLAHAEAADAARGDLFDADWGAWGEFAVPTWYGKGRTPDTTALAASLSLWTGPRPAFDAVHSGAHRTALRRRADWFERTGRANHVLWWVPEDTVPTWRDGVARLEHLDGHGAAPDGFTFRDAYAQDGAPTRVRADGGNGGLEG